MSITTEIERLQTAKANIKTAIENKGITVGDGTIDTYAEKINEISGGGSGDYDQGYEDGKNSVIPFERYARQMQILSLNVFGKSEAVLYLDSAEALVAVCTVQGQGNPNVNTTVEHLTINCPNQVTSLNQMLHCDNFNVDKTLKRVTLNVDTQKSGTNGNAFNNLQALEIIDGTPINLSSSTTNNMFGNCTALVHVRFAPLTIPKNISFSKSEKLDEETRQNIIDGLADLTGQTAQTITFHTDMVLLLTEEQILQITNKNWRVG